MTWQFDHPERIHWVWIFLVLWILLSLWRRSCALRTRQRMGDSAYQQFMAQHSRAKDLIKQWALWGAWICLCVTVMIPRWGLEEQEAVISGLDMMVCVDVSRSMLAEDVLPNRLERTKLDLQDMVQAMSSDRVGLVAFAGAAVALCPLTLDHDYFLGQLEALSPESAPRGGTLIGDAVRKALDSFEKSEGRTRVIMVVTDGEDHDSLPLEAAKQAAAVDVRIFTVGIGDDQRGAPIPITRDGIKQNMRYQGELVLSKMDSQSLKSMASLSGGAYIPAKTSLLHLDQIYQKHILPLERVQEQSQRVNRTPHRFQWFCGLAIIFLGIDLLLGKRRQPKVTAL